MTADQRNPPASGIKTLGGYLSMLAGTAASYWYIRGRGMQLDAPVPTGLGRFGAISEVKNVDALMAIVFVALLASSLATDYIGIHAVFGAFALGAVIPHDSGLARELTDRLEDLVIVLFLPAFFAFTGMRTQIGLVSGMEQWLSCGLIILVACAGKFGGSMAAARLTGLGWRDAAALGVLMNTRGLMELIVLNIGLELKVISPTLFAMLVIMAIATTFATTPLLHLLTRKHPFEDDMPSQPMPVVAGIERQGGLLLPVSNPVALPPLLELAMAVTRTTDPATEVLALVRRPPGGIRSGLREREGRQQPHTPLLDEALARASAKNAHIRTRALWTDDPADDIVAAAADRLGAARLSPRGVW